MAYDDESRFSRFDEVTREAILQLIREAQISNVSAAQLVRLVQAAHKISVAQGGSPGILQLAQGLREEGLSTIPFDTVVKVTDIVSGIPGNEDVLANVSLRDIQNFI